MLSGGNQRPGVGIRKALAPGLSLRAEGSPQMQPFQVHKAHHGMCPVFVDVRWVVRTAAGCDGKLGAGCGKDQVVARRQRRRRQGIVENNHAVACAAFADSSKLIRGAFFQHDIRVQVKAALQKDIAVGDQQDAPRTRRGQHERGLVVGGKVVFHVI